MHAGTPFGRLRALFVAVGALARFGLPPTMMQAERTRILGGYRSRGKGGGYVAHHAGARKVAWDKRDATKRRNRLRAKGRRV